MREQGTVPFQVRLTAEEKAAFCDAAALRGLNVSSWVRLHLRERAAAELRAAGKACALPELKMIARRGAGEVPVSTPVARPATEVTIITSGAFPGLAGQRSTVACVFAEDPTKLAIVPMGGTVDAGGRVFNSRGEFLGTAVYPANSASVAIAVAAAAGAKNVYLFGEDRGVSRETGDVRSVGLEGPFRPATGGRVPTPIDDDFALEPAPAAAPARSVDPPEE